MCIELIKPLCVCFVRVLVCFGARVCLCACVRVLFVRVLCVCLFAYVRAYGLLPLQINVGSFCKSSRLEQARPEPSNTAPKWYCLWNPFWHHHTTNCTRTLNQPRDLGSFLLFPSSFLLNQCCMQQEIVNRERDTLEVDLDDIFEVCLAPT